MNTGRLVTGLLALPVLLTIAVAQAAPPLPDLDDKPSPQIDAGGPSAAVTALAFSADGATLYAAGLDKVVRVWTLQQGHFVFKTAFRVPVGPGNAGSLNAVALSPDGAWVALAGRAPMRGEVGFRQEGVIVDAASLSTEQNEDVGLIYVANTANPAGGKVLRGHRGGVRALAFAPARQGNPPLLVSAATEHDGGQQYGGLRLWDVATGKELAERDDLPATATTPGLAVWHTGPAATQVRVAVAWPEKDDGAKCYLRLWDPAPDALPLQRWEADRYLETAALLGQEGDGHVLTGGVGPTGGRLRAWTFSADRDTQARLSTAADFPPNDKVHFLPVSLAVVPSPDGGAPTHASVVLQSTVRHADFRLALVERRNQRVVANVLLSGSDSTQRPAVAASSRHIVVAAAADHALRVYAVADLLAGKTEPAAVLAGQGLAPRQVAFVDKGRGLWLSEDAKARPLSGGLVFDLDKRQLRANDGADLAADAPKMDAWSLTFDEDKKGVRVRDGDNKLPPVRLHGKSEEVTAAALRPGGPGRPAVLAVAYTEVDANRTLIVLCDPATGKPFRLLVGHLQNVRDLAFSATRPLLASVADDQTVCVWSLADLDRAIGAVPGLSVGDKDKKVVVLRVEEGSAAAKAKLAEGDVLEKVGAVSGAAKPIKDAAAFLLAVAARQPGGQVAVTVAGKGVAQLPVERGVDERNPLFSLFLVRSAKLPEWIGWSPAGPYDTSGPTAEAHLGWHTNTRDPAAPVEYVAARVHQKEYYREGLLHYLATEADLSRALRKWDVDHPAKPPQPSLRPLRPEGAQPGARVNEYLVRQAVKAVCVGINKDYTALDAQHVLRWRLTRADGGKVTADAAEASGQAPRDGDEWRTDLSKVAWRRGEYRLRVGLHAGVDKPELASETITLRFQPPAPTLALRVGDKVVPTTEAKPLEIMEDKVGLKIAVAAPAGQEVAVQFGQYRNGLPRKDAPAAQVQTGAGTLAQDFKLHEGLNRVTVRAVNKGALVGHEGEESTEAEFWVKYKAPVEGVPRFTGVRLEPEPEVKRLDGKDVWVVSKPAVRLFGKVEAEGVLVRADWSAGGAPKSFLPAKAGRAAELAADLKLTAGEVVTVRLRAQSQHSDENTAERWVVFHPPLPAITIEPLNSQDVLSEKITLTGKFEAATKEPFDLSFRVSSPAGKTKSFKPEVEPKTGQWKVELSLFPGSNTIATVVANKWRGERALDGALTLRYRRPPQITAFPKEVEAVETNKVKLSVTVAGPAGRPLTEVQVNGHKVAFEPGQPVRKGEREVWPVELPEVFVNDGERNLDQVSIRAITDEGESEPAVVRVVHKKLPRLPRVRFVSPTANDTARRPEYPVTFRVESERPLEYVEIRRGDQVIYKADLKKAEREGALHVLQAEALLTLHPGTNTLQLVAVNTDGRSPNEEVTVSYNEPAVLVSLDRVELQTDKGDVRQVLQPSYSADGTVTFPKAPQSLVWLIGQVRWSDPKAKALNDPRLELVAKVGDVRQFPVALGPRGQGDAANVRPFRVPVWLVKEDNRIKIELPSVGTQERSLHTFDLACSVPATKQRLHVLIVGVNVKDAAELKKRVLDALVVDAAERPTGPQGEFYKKPPFERCVLYHVLAGEVDRAQVEGQLVEINSEIERLKNETGYLNDVVLVYYQGADVAVPEKRERWLLTSRNIQFPKEAPQSFAIPCHALPRVPGVQLLLLNVAGAPNARAVGPDWGGDPDTGFMRYACQDPAEAANSDPALLGVLQEAVRTKSRLGDVVEYVNGLLDKQAKKFSPLVILDKDQESRRLSGPER